MIVFIVFVSGRMCFFKLATGGWLGLAWLWVMDTRSVLVTRAANLVCMWHLQEIISLISTKSVVISFVSVWMCYNLQWPTRKMTPTTWVVFGISHILYILYAWFNPSNQIFMEFVNQSRKNQPDTSTKSGEIFVWIYPLIFGFPKTRRN